MSNTANETISAEEYRQQNQSEEDIHKAVVEWADRQAQTLPALDFLFHVPNGGSRHVAEAEKLRRMGTRQGVPDLLLPIPRAAGCGLALELKSPSGRLRPTQAWWLDHLREAGWAVAVAWTFSEARHVLRSYLDGEEIEQRLDLTIAEPPRHVEGT
ncbi:hypothetical protein [Salinibacter phage B2_17]